MLSNGTKMVIIKRTFDLLELIARCVFDLISSSIYLIEHTHLKHLSVHIIKLEQLNRW
jgi:hypothetical protein